MFTGLIEAICEVKAVSRNAGAMVLTMDLGGLDAEYKIGDSIAINGVCLTVAALNGTLVSFDVSGETLSKTTLGKLVSSSRVNVERAMKPSERFGGHFVLGHIDGTATIKQIDRRGDFADITFSAGPKLLDQMVDRGSVAVDGISLTITAMDGSSFAVALIPETLKKTTLGRAKTGDIVNIETDIIVKTVIKQLGKVTSREEKLTVERLKQLGY